MEACIENFEKRFGFHFISAKYLLTLYFDAPQVTSQLIQRTLTPNHNHNSLLTVLQSSIVECLKWKIEKKWNSNLLSHNSDFFLKVPS